jgi:tetratricopeptide (TPR) repeat protein
MGRKDESLREITRSVTEAPTLKRHEYLSAEALPLLSEEERRAVEDGFRQALARDYPEALQNFAEFYAKLNRFSDQAELYEQAALKESDVEKKTQLLINGGVAYVKAAGSTEQGAASQRSEIRDQRSEVGPSQSASSSKLHATGSELHAAAAEHLFRAAIAANPTDARAYQQLVTTIFAAKQDLDGAKDVIASGIKNGAPPLPLYLSLAEAAQGTGNAKESKAALESAKAEVDKLVQNGQTPFTLYIALAEGARNAGDKDEEAAALLKALDLQPRSTDVLSRLANVYLKKQNYDRAALYLNRVAQINPGSADVYFNLAVAEEARYRFADAGRAYARAIELAPKKNEYRQRYEEFQRRVEQNRSSSNERQKTADGGSVFSVGY